MKKEFLNHSIVILITISAAVIIIMIGRMEPIVNNKLFDFPTNVGSWHSKEIPMGKEIYDSLETPYAFLRIYSSPSYSSSITLSVVWFDDRYIAFHAPESCLGGVGNYIQETSKISINLGRPLEVVKLIVEKDGLKQVVLYFYDVDGKTTTSQSSLRITLLLKNLELKRTSVSYIRLMAPITSSEDETLEMMKEFIRDIYRYIPEYTYIQSII